MHQLAAPLQNEEITRPGYGLSGHLNIFKKFNLKNYKAPFFQHHHNNSRSELLFQPGMREIFINTHWNREFESGVRRASLNHLTSRISSESIFVIWSSLASFLHSCDRQQEALAATITEGGSFPHWTQGQSDVKLSQHLASVNIFQIFKSSHFDIFGWQVLGHGSINLQSSFFACGGDSVTALRCAAVARQRGPGILELRSNIKWVLYTYMEVGTDISEHCLCMSMPITRLYYMCIHLHSIQIHVCVSTIHICSPCLANHDVEFWLPISTWFDLKTLLEAEYFGPVAAECQDLGTGRWGWKLKHGWLHL